MTELDRSDYCEVCLGIGGHTLACSVVPRESTVDVGALVAERDALRAERDRLQSAVRIMNEQSPQARIRELEAERDELLRKGELLCQQNGHLLVQQARYRKVTDAARTVYKEHAGLGVTAYAAHALGRALAGVDNLKLEAKADAIGQEAADGS